jgi:hypothetical protein
MSRFLKPALCRGKACRRNPPERRRPFVSYAAGPQSQMDHGPRTRAAIEARASPDTPRRYRATPLQRGPKPTLWKSPLERGARQGGVCWGIGPRLTLPSSGYRAMLNRIQQTPLLHSSRRRRLAPAASRPLLHSSRSKPRGIEPTWSNARRAAVSAPPHPVKPTAWRPGSPLPFSGR